MCIAGLLLLVPTVASADTVMLFMRHGPENSERMELIGGELRSAGHKPMMTGASLEDSALMLGCEAETPTCVATIIETGGADAAIIVPQDAGSLVVHRGGATKSETINAGASEYDWKLALAKAFGLPTPQAPTTPTTSPPSGMGGTSVAEPEPGLVTSSSTGGFAISSVETRSWVVLGSGVGTSVLGMILLSVASGKQDKVDKHPVDTVGDLEALRRLESSGANYNLSGNIFLIAGGVATLTGVGLMIWDLQSAGESGPTVIPTASETSVGVSLQWSNF